MRDVPDSHAELLREPLTAVLSTIGPDGQPQSTAVWYLVDGMDLTVSVRTDRQKYRNVLRDPRATLFVIDPTNSVRTLELRCVVEIRDDPTTAHAAKFTPTYGAPPSAWDPEGIERAVLVLTPMHVVTLG
jgi:PPOX class probable F420-dependent enzyme